MPPAFHPDRLRTRLAPFTTRQPLSAQAQDYQRFYGLNLPAHSWLGSFQAAGFDLVGQAWLPEQPSATLFLLHGYYDHMGLYRHVIEWALKQGFAVISCDLPGHGLSSGERASINDFAVYQQVLEALFEQAHTLQLPHPWHLCGQSTGGAIAVDHLLYHAHAAPSMARSSCWPRWCGHVPGAGRSSVIACCATSSMASNGASVRTPTTRPSCRSWRPTRCNRVACQRPGWAH